jgi:flavin reductase (DIM6/NTAB) family NADH-FMN oxidoreductase RutF
MRESGRFSVNVLSSGQSALAAHFGQPSTIDKLNSVAWRASTNGMPLLDDAMAWFECRVEGELPAGDHCIITGRVTDGEQIQSFLQPMNYRETGDMDGSAALLPETLANR